MSLYSLISASGTFKAVPFLGGDARHSPVKLLDRLRVLSEQPANQAEDAAGDRCAEAEDQGREVGGGRGLLASEDVRDLLDEALHNLKVDAEAGGAGRADLDLDLGLGAVERKVGGIEELADREESRREIADVHDAVAQRLAIVGDREGRPAHVLILELGPCRIKHASRVDPLGRAPHPYLRKEAYLIALTRALRELATAALDDQADRATAYAAAGLFGVSFEDDAEAKRRQLLYWRRIKPPHLAVAP